MRLVGNFHIGGRTSIKGLGCLFKMVVFGWMSLSFYVCICEFTYGPMFLYGKGNR